MLLRAVNVGGRTLKSAVWATILSGISPAALPVGTSGNAVLEAPDRLSPAVLEERIEKTLKASVGYQADAFVRTLAEWDRLIGRNPFPQAAVEDPAHLVMTVLKAAPAPGAWSTLRDAIQGREQTAPGERAAYVVYPDGIGTSKLTAVAIEQALGVRGTSRNWNTVLRLRDLARSWAPPP